MKEGRIVKSAKMLNRPLEKIIMLETAEGNAEPVENVAYVHAFKADGADTTLIDLIPFFRGAIVELF